VCFCAVFWRNKDWLIDSLIESLIIHTRRDSLVVSVLDQRQRGRGFESSAGHGRSHSNRGPVAVCSLHPGPGLTQPSILSGSVKEYRLRLGRYKAGTCDAAWCAPCTWAPLRWQSLYLGCYTSVRPFLHNLYMTFLIFRRFCSSSPCWMSESFKVQSHWLLSHRCVHTCSYVVDVLVLAATC